MNRKRLFVMIAFSVALGVAPEAGILAFEDCHTSGSLVGKKGFHPYMEAYRTCLCHTYRL